MASNKVMINQILFNEAKNMYENIVAKAVLNNRI
jgi:hypothetical protein